MDSEEPIIYKLSKDDNTQGSPFVCGFIDRVFRRKRKPRFYQFMDDGEMKRYTKSRMTDTQVAKYNFGFTNAIKIIKGKIDCV